jgi:hypothetical protein
VAVGLAVLAFLFLTPPGRILMAIWDVIGFVESIRGKSLLTGERLSWWQRALGVVPFVPVGRALGKAEEIAGAMRGVRGAETAVSREIAEALGKGHTLERHVGKTEAELFKRLADERRITAASSFHNQEVAERAVADAISSNKHSIETWLAGKEPVLPLTHAAETPVGIAVPRGANQAREATGVRVVLRRDPGSPLGYYVVTAYPKP